MSHGRGVNSTELHLDLPGCWVNAITLCMSKQTSTTTSNTAPPLLWTLHCRSKAFCHLENNRDYIHIYIYI